MKKRVHRHAFLAADVLAGCGPIAAYQRRRKQILDNLNRRRVMSYRTLRISVVTVLVAVAGCGRSSAEREAYQREGAELVDKLERFNVVRAANYPEMWSDLERTHRLFALRCANSNSTLASYKEFEVAIKRHRKAFNFWRDMVSMGSQRYSSRDDDLKRWRPIADDLFGKALEAQAYAIREFKAGR